MVFVCMWGEFLRFILLALSSVQHCIFFIATYMPIELSAHVHQDTSIRMFITVLLIKVTNCTQLLLPFIAKWAHIINGGA